MRKLIGKTEFVVVVLMASALASRAQDRQGSAPGRLTPTLALDYSYMRSNAPPGGSGSFNLNGGSVTLAWPLAATRFALIGDVTAGHASGISSSGYGLTLSSYTAGVRYIPRCDHWPVQPYGQALIGVAHSSGSLVQGQNSVASNSAAAFAAYVGGGLDLTASRRILLRLVEADYLVTTIDNGSNNHQNNLRISAGVVLRF